MATRNAIASDENTPPQQTSTTSPGQQGPQDQENVPGAKPHPNVKLDGSSTPQQGGAAESSREEQGPGGMGAAGIAGGDGNTEGNTIINAREGIFCSVFLQSLNCFLRYFLETHRCFLNLRR